LSSISVDSLRRRGFYVSLVHNGSNLFVEPETIPAPLLEEIKKNKQALIEELTEMQGPTIIPRVGDTLFKSFEEIKKSKAAKYLIGDRCGECFSLQRSMNAYGVSGCIKNRDRIIDDIHKRAMQRSLFLRLASGTVRGIIAELVDDAIEKCRMSAVWVYWSGGAVSDELRYSMRSARKNLTDLKNIVLCGDKPDWYQGEFIHSPRFGRAKAKAEFGSGRFCKWIDSIIKLQKIIDDESVTENFLWMYDDTFIMRETSIYDISRPRACGELYAGDSRTPSKRKWREVRRRTHNALVSRGFTTHDYSTHYPIVYNKTLLRQTIDEFDARRSARVIESLYMNQHHGEPNRFLNADLQYTKAPMPGWRVLPEITVLNIGRFNQVAAPVIKRAFWVKSQEEL